MSIATALQAKIDEKEAIRLAIETKGVTVDPSVLLSGYPTKIDEISTGGGDGYQRPADWLEIDSLVVDGDEKFVGLYAIYEDSNFIALKFKGNYTVDWGDGVVENFNSNNEANHQYDYADFVGTESTKGYRQAIVTVTPNGGTLTSVDLQEKHNQIDLQSYSIPWLDIKISGSNITSLTIGSANQELSLLEQFSFIGAFLDLNLSNLFDSCYQLQSILSLDTSLVTDMGSMFSSCTSLRIMPLLDTSSVTLAESMFFNCYSLQTIPLLDTSLIGNMFSMFNACYSLQTIPLLNTSSAFNLNSMFSNCFSLQTIPLLDASNVSSLSNMFSQCDSLQKGAMSGTKVTISYDDCKLSQSALVDVFNGLATVVGQTITITSNWGAAGLTVGERAIATDKGWTIVG